MIIGIGHDICDQRRITRLLERFGRRFLSRVLTSAEQSELATRANKAAYLAGRFAVKEAVYKALSSANQTGMHWQHAQTLSSAAGAPVLTLSGACHAGHGLSFETAGQISCIPEIVELNIGHFLMGAALFTGLPDVIAQMRRIMDEGRTNL